MPSSSAQPFAERKLLVLALGGNALSPPVESGEDYDAERSIIAKTGQLLGRLIERGWRLLVVHGNGPQVGRLLRADPARGNLDIHIAQTQGELGYLLAAPIPGMACVLTRVVVGETPGAAVKPVGPILERPPADGSPAVATGHGWRVAVPSPRPLRVVELELIAGLVRTCHLVAGGGGGIPVTEDGTPVAGVVDKDWTASLLARELGASALVFATDVECVYERYESAGRAARPELTCDEARALVARGEAPAGSMGPKLEGAAAFVAATGRPARICHLEQIEAALDGAAGTRVAG